VAPGADRDPGRGGSPRDRALIDDAAAGIQQVECHGAATVVGTSRPVDPRHRLAVTVAQVGEAAEEPAGQAQHPPVDQVHPDAVDPRQPGLKIR
jgi:hypothetical protein